MEIYRKKNMLVANSEVEVGHPADYIVKIINVYSAVRIGRPFWLTEREKQFFVALVILLNKGTEDYKSEAAGEIIRYYFGKHKKGARTDYVNKLEEKGWLEKIGGNIKLLPLFTNIDLEKDSFRLNLSIKIEEDDNRRDFQEDGSGENG